MGELPQEQEKETARPFDGGYKMGSLEIIVLVIIFAFIAWGTYEFVVWTMGQLAPGMSK